MHKSAWELYNKKDYAAAAKKARTCIYFFQGKAWDEEKELEGKQPVPLTGDIPDEKERQKVFKRGQLNDVATCYFIVGSSYEHLYLKKIEAGSKKDEDKSAAIEAYQSACKYKYARTAEKNLTSFGLLPKSRPTPCNDSARSVRKRIRWRGITKQAHRGPERSTLGCNRATAAMSTASIVGWNCLP